MFLLSNLVLSLMSSSFSFNCYCPQLNSIHSFDFAIDNPQFENIVVYTHTQSDIIGLQSWFNNCVDSISNNSQYNNQDIEFVYSFTFSQVNDFDDSSISYYDLKIYEISTTYHHLSSSNFDRVSVVEKYNLPNRLNLAYFDCDFGFDFGGTLYEPSITNYSYIQGNSYLNALVNSNISGSIFDGLYSLSNVNLNVINAESFNIAFSGNSYQEGYDIGYNDGKNDGYNQGKIDGGNSSYLDGYQDGHNAGVLDGQQSSDNYQNGYADGYLNGVNQSNKDYGLINLFTSIADTPILMMRSLFDFSVFGTSVLAVVLTLFTSLICLHLLKKVIK